MERDDGGLPLPPTSPDAASPSHTPRLPLSLSREWREVTPSLLLGRERFKGVDESYSAKIDPHSDAPLAIARGSNLLPAPPETLVQALERTAAMAGERGITYVSSGHSRHESYASLLLYSRRAAGVLQQRGLTPREPVVLQLTDSQAHLRAFWACALAGLPSLSVSVPPRFSRDHPIAAKLLSATSQLGAKWVLASDGVCSSLRSLLPHVEVLEASFLAGPSLRPLPLPLLPATDPSSVLFFQLTSGSTGECKLIPETHAAVISHIRQAALQAREMREEWRERRGEEKCMVRDEGVRERREEREVRERSEERELREKRVLEETKAVRQVWESCEEEVRKRRAEEVGIREMNQEEGERPSAGEGEVSLNWLPFDHVVPLLTFHLADVYTSRAAIQLATEDVIAEPLCWLREMARWRVTHSWAPNFGFKLVATALREASEQSSLALGDLSCVKSLVNAGEMVTVETCEAFLSLTKLPSWVLKPSFGMAETATCITYASYSDDDAVIRVAQGNALSLCLLPPSRAPSASPSPSPSLSHSPYPSLSPSPSPTSSCSPPPSRSFASPSPASCSPNPPPSASPSLSSPYPSPRTRVAPDGPISSFVCLGPPSPGVEIRIVAPASQSGEFSLLREKQIGMLQIRGACVMKGYLKLPHINAECFTCDGWLDSGDLGFLHHGKLVLTGRAKELIIVRGANFHCHEVEEVAGGVRGVETAHVGATSVRDQRAGTEVLLLFFVPSEALAIGALPHLHDQGLLIEALRRVVMSIRHAVVNAFGLEPRYVVPLPKGVFPRTTSGKIMRGALKAAFLRGAFAKACDALDLALDGASEFSFPDFFAAPTWHPQPVAGELGCEERVLLLAPANILAGMAGELSLRVNLVSASSSLGCRELLSLLFKWEPTHIAHAMLLSSGEGGGGGGELDGGEQLEPQGVSTAVQHLLDLARAVQQWLRKGRAGRRKLSLVCLRYSCRDTARGTLLYECTAAGIASSICKALLAENSGLARAVTLQIPPGAPPALAALLTSAELRNGCSLDMDVMYEADCTRYVRRFRSTGLELQAELQAKAARSPLRAHAAYVVSGGLGALGREVVRWLLSDELSDGSSILVVGRRAAEEGELMLRELGWSERVVYACVNLGADSSGLRAALASFLARTGRVLCCVFHLAGEYARVRLEDLTPVQVADLTRAKVWGAVHLHDAVIQLGSQPHPFFVHFGSVATVYGGDGLAAYSSANAFLVWFAAWQRERCGVEACTIEWASWEDAGISLRDETLSMASWLAPLPVELGMRALKRLMTSTNVRRQGVLVGIERHAPEIGCLFCDGSTALERPCLFYTANQCPNPSLCEAHKLIYLPNPPLTRAGGVDTEALRTRPLLELLGKPSLTARSASALAEVEQLSTSHGVLQLVLDAVHTTCGVRLDADGNLFEAGLSSLTSARLRVALQKKLGLELPQSLLFERPGVSCLALSLFERLQSNGAVTPGHTSAPTAEEPQVMLVRAADMLRKGEYSAAHSVTSRAAEALGVELSAEGLRALSSCLSEPSRLSRLAPLLKVASVLWRQSQAYTLAAMGWELLLASCGLLHPDAPILLVKIALAHLEQNNAAECAEALSRCAHSPHKYSAQGHVAEEERRKQHSALLLGTRISEVASVAAPSPKTLLSLTLSRLALAQLPESVLQLSRLQRLDVSHNALTKLPHSIDRLRGLRELHASCNHLTSLPPGLALLPQLFVLALQSNCFLDVPEVALTCRRLRELKWGAQRPPAECAANLVQASTQLVLLEMEANRATAMPGINAQNRYLGAVLASFNQLTAIPCSLINHASSLKKLHLGCNAIERVDDVLPHLVHLTELCLEGNLLSSLPADIGHLTKLRELWIHGNQLATLPQRLGQCKSLTVLQAHHNQLRELPETLSALSCMQGLYLQSNLLTNLSEMRERILKEMPLQNLALGANMFNLADAFELPNCRVGLGWNRGTPPPHLPLLTDRFAAADHSFEPAHAGMVGDILIVAFSAQGPGMQQWHAPAAALRAAGLHVDALYLADPSNSFYLQDPSGGWGGLAYFDQLVRSFAGRYGRRVIILGSSMGATAALHHARLATRVLSFAPRVDLSLSHGAFVPASTREASLAAITQGVLQSMPGGVVVHVGTGNHVDMAQVDRLPKLESVKVIAHDTFHHNVPAYLEGQGELVALIKSEALDVLRWTLSGGRRFGCTLE